MRALRSIALAAVFLLPVAVLAVQPDEMLTDPALETRARDISDGLRCLVCRNENIDESNAGLARDMRLLVRERLVEGDSNEQVVDFIVDRYGEYVLLNPRFTLANALIWFSGPALLLGGGWLAWGFIRRRETAAKPAPAPLTAEETRRLERLMNG